MISKSFANSINASLFGNVSFAVDNWYFGFSTQEIVDGVIPSNAEPKNPGYRRYQMINNANYFNTPTYITERPISAVTNTRAIDFTILSGVETTVTYWFLSKEKSGNTAEIWGKFENPISLSPGVKIVIPASNLFLTVNNA